ncbi:MAG: hypothetical protein OSB07_09210 [Dehalococcoidia bacterium]|nr:hypothetical protein [Dehalococcoidia bacterium]
MFLSPYKCPIIAERLQTVANALAPKAAAGGSNLKLVSYLGLMCLVSGFTLAVVPVVTGMIFGI